MIASAPAPEPQPTPHAEIISAAKLADRAGIRLRTVKNWIDAEILPQPIRIRGRRYFRISDVQHLFSME